MIFQRQEPNVHYRELRLVEQLGGWELGLTLSVSGMRLRMGKGGRPPSVLDFCMGRDAAWYGPIFKAVLDRLHDLPGSASAREIDGKFPWKGTRPDLAMHLPELLGSRPE